MKRYLIRTAEPEFWGAGRLTVGIWLLYLSNLYISSLGAFRLKIAMYPDMIVYLMFGAVHAYIMHQFNKIIYEDTPKIGPVVETLYIVSDIFVYTAFYSIVLLPLCGVGIIEWIVLAYMLISTLVIAQDHTAVYRFFSPLSFLIIGLCLFLLKVSVTTIFPQNIYREMISGIDTVRWFLFAMAVVMLVYYIKGLFDFRKQNTVAVSDRHSGKRLAAFFGQKAKRLLSIVFTAPFLITVLGIVVPLLLIGGAVGFFILGSMMDDFWEAATPLLERLLTTDRQNIILSKSLMIFQTLAYLLYIIYFYYNNNILQKHIDERFEKISTRINDYYPEEYASLILNDLSKKDKILIAATWKDFHRRVEESFRQSDYSSIGHKNEEDFKGFYRRDIGGNGL